MKEWGHIQFCNQWVEVLKFGKGYNWVTFSPLHIEFEYEKYGPCLTLTIIVLGFGIYGTIILPGETPQSRELKDIVSKSMICTHCGKDQREEEIPKE